MNFFFFEKNVVNIHLNTFLLSRLQKSKTDLGKNTKFRKLFYVVKKYSCLGPSDKHTILKT